MHRLIHREQEEGQRPPGTSIKSAWGFLISERKEKSLKTLGLFTLFILFLPVLIHAQESYHNCGMEGDAHTVPVRALNELKNRYHAPKTEDFDTSVTLAKMIEPGNDENRWDSSRAAEIIGYVHDVKVGGVESCNCHARDPLYRALSL